MEYLELSEYLHRAEDMSQLAVRLEAISKRDDLLVTAADVAVVAALAIHKMFSHRPSGPGNPHGAMSLGTAVRRYGGA